MVIASSTNGQIKKIKKLLKNARFRREEDLFAAEGWKITGEAIKRGLARQIYIAESAKKEWQEKLAAQAETEGIQTEWVTDSLFHELSDTVSPQGILTIAKMPHYQREKLLAGEKAAILVLENVQDPGNLGTMLRTAEGAGMSGVILSKGCVDLFNPKVVRATMGALLRVPYLICEDLSTEVELLKKEGFSVYAAHLSGERDYTEGDYRGKTAILIGNEANGLSEEISAQADCLVKIPMEGELESLNAAVSAALFMYEIHRNR